MSDTQPTAAQPDPPQEPPSRPTEPTEPAPLPEAAAVPAAPRTRLRDLVFGLRSLVAVALAGVVLGGLAGFGIHAATDGDGRDGRMGRFGPGAGFGGGPGGPGGFPQGPGGQGGPRDMGPGQMGPGQQLPPQGQPSAAPTPTPSTNS